MLLPSGYCNNYACTFKSAALPACSPTKIFCLRRYTIPIDHIGFEFEVLQCEHEDEISGKPDDGKSMPRIMKGVRHNSLWFLLMLPILFGFK